MKPARVLVVEPDGLLRTLVAEWLEQVGIHAVFPAAFSNGGPCEVTAKLEDVGHRLIGE